MPGLFVTLKSMHIVFLNRTLSAFDGSDRDIKPLSPVQLRIIFVAEALALQGHEVSVFCQGPAATVNIRQVNYRPLPQLARYARQNTLDYFVVTDDESALKLGIQARFTLAWVHQDFAPLLNEAPDLRAKLALLLSERADKVIALSHWHAKRLIQCFTLDIQHVTVLPTDTFATFLTPPSLREAAAVNGGEPKAVRIAYSAAAYNGLEQFVSWFPRLQSQTSCPLQLHIYANPQLYALPQKQLASLLKGYQTLAEQNISQIIFHPPMSLVERAQALAENDLWVYPQHAGQPFSFFPAYWMDAEASSLELHLAQWAGLTAVCSARGALTEVLEGTGISVPEGRNEKKFEADFLAVCLTLIEDAEKRSAIASVAVESAKRNATEARVGKAWSEMLTGLVSSRGISQTYTTAYREPLISVIIPTYNRSRNLYHCLKALTDQTEEAFEVIVCDDGSTDDTRAVVMDFADRLNLRYRWQPDQGFRAAEARNLGIRLARGKYLVFLDSDVIVPSTFLKAHRQALEQTPGAVVNSYVYRMTAELDEDLGLAPEIYIPRHRDILKPDSRDRYQLFEREGPIDEAYFLDSNAMSLSRKTMDKLGAFDAEFVGWGHEDTELGYRISQQGITFFLIKTDAVAYHQYHYISENKEAERAGNWQRLTQKHGITRWYHPLWELPISMSLTLLNKSSLFNAFESVSGRWVLNTGDSFSILPQPLLLEVSEGVLTGIQQASGAGYGLLIENS